MSGRGLFACDLWAPQDAFAVRMIFPRPSLMSSSARRWTGRDKAGRSLRLRLGELTDLLVE